MDFTTTSRVILSGASGMLGKAVRRALDTNGIRSLQLVRRKTTTEGELQWSPSSDPAIPDPLPLEAANAAIHLSGANVAAHRWTDSYKHEMIASRVDSTRRLATALAGLRQPPATLVIASAIEIYGDRGDATLDESSPAGNGFLANLCQAWEAAANPARQAGIRVVNLRFGVVLGPGVGALQQMLPPFKLGLGARIGSGRQWMSWVGLDDAVGAVLLALQHRDIAGAVNVTSPHPVTNADFTRVLARQLHRLAFLSVPSFAMELLFGQMADEALLASARVKPRKLIDAGFHFSQPNLDQALAAALWK